MAEAGQRASAHSNRVEVSSGNNLVLHQVKANDSRSGLGVEMATDGVANHLPEFIQRSGFREDRVPQSARLETALRRFLNLKNDLRSIHGNSLIPILAMRRAKSKRAVRVLHHPITHLVYICLKRRATGK